MGIDDGREHAADGGEVAGRGLGEAEDPAEPEAVEHEADDLARAGGKAVVTDASLNVAAAIAEGLHAVWIVDEGGDEDRAAAAEVGGPLRGAGEAGAHGGAGEAAGALGLRVVGGPEFVAPALDGAVDHRVDEGVFAREMMEEAAFAEAGFGGDRVEGEAADAVAEDDALGGIEEGVAVDGRVAAALRAGGGRREWGGGGGGGGA